MNIKTEIVLEKFSNVIWNQKCWAILEEDTSSQLFDSFTDLEIDRLKWSWPFASLEIGCFMLDSTGGEPTKPELLDRFKQDLFSKPDDMMVSPRDYLLLPSELKVVQADAGLSGDSSEDDLRSLKISRSELRKCVMEPRLAFLREFYEAGRSQPITNNYKRMTEWHWWGLDMLTIGILWSIRGLDAMRTTPDEKGMKFGMVVNDALKVTANMLGDVLSERCEVHPSRPN